MFFLTEEFPSLGGYDKEEKAARAYDLAALKYWGSTTTTNFPLTNYEKELEEMKNMTRQEFVASLRRSVSLSSPSKKAVFLLLSLTRVYAGRVVGSREVFPCTEV